MNADALNPEVELNREDYHEGNSWEYWKLQYIEKFVLEIQFTYNNNDPTHQAQVLKGPIEHFIDGKLVSSE